MDLNDDWRLSKSEVRRPIDLCYVSPGKHFSLEIVELANLFWFNGVIKTQWCFIKRCFILLSDNSISGLIGLFLIERMGLATFIFALFFCLCKYIVSDPPGKRIPEEGVSASWLSSQWHSAWEHGGGHFCQRGWKQGRLHILQRVYLQTWWTLKSLSVLLFTQAVLQSL